jgi:hypothetical protein
MTDTARPKDRKSDEVISLAEAKRKHGTHRRDSRATAASSLLGPAIEPAAAGAMLDADPRLDDRSETQEALERAKGTPD